MPFTKPLPNSNLRSSSCAVLFAVLSSSCWLVPFVFRMAKDCAVAGRPAIYERACQWVNVISTLRGAIAVATWDDPQVLLREMEGCCLRLPTSLNGLWAAATLKDRMTPWPKSSTTPLTDTKLPVPTGR